MIYDFLVSGFMRAYDLFSWFKSPQKNYFIKKEFFETSFFLSHSTDLNMSFVKTCGHHWIIFTVDCKRSFDFLLESILPILVFPSLAIKIRHYDDVNITYKFFELSKK